MRVGLLVVAILLYCGSSYGQSKGLVVNEDEAKKYAKKFKDDDVLMESSYQFFTFDKGKNDLGDKVVSIEENAEYIYSSMKKFSSATHGEFYNRFIGLKTFKRAIQYSGKYITLEKGGYDRSVTGDDIFFDDSRMQFFSMRFSGIGTKQRITVKKNYADGKYLTRLFFNQAYPAVERVFEFKVPTWLNLEIKKMNFEGHKIEVTETTKGGYTNYVYVMKDVAAAKNEYKRIGRASTDPHIIIQIKTFENKGETVKGFDKVDDVYAWNNRLYEMAGNDQEKLKAQAAKIVQGKTTDIDKIKAIYYWVQDNVRYIAYEDGYSGYIPSPAQDVLTKKYGDCKGMANLLTELLKLNNFDAHFAWVGTKDIPYSQSLPALCVNNHAICVLNFNGKKYFLDGTEKYVPFDENAFRIQGKEVMVANGPKFEIAPVPETKAADNKISTKADFTLVGEAMKGKVKVTVTGNLRKDFHQSYQDLPSTSQEEFLNDYLEFGNENILATNVKTSDLKNRDLPVTIDGDIDLSNSINSINGDLYLGIDFFPKTLERFIPDEKRQYGYDLGSVVQFEDEISLTIPAGKKVIDLPESIEFTNDGYEFKGTYTLTNNKLVLKKVLSIKKTNVKKSEFENWTKFINSIKKFNQYLITITKK